MTQTTQNNGFIHIQEYLYLGFYPNVYKMKSMYECHGFKPYWFILGDECFYITSELALKEDFFFIII